jgi:hypothetical protein
MMMHKNKEQSNLKGDFSRPLQPAKLAAFYETDIHT